MFVNSVCGQRVKVIWGFFFKPVEQQRQDYNQCGVSWKDAGSGSHLNGMFKYSAAQLNRNTDTFLHLFMQSVSYRYRGGSMIL